MIHQRKKIQDATYYSRTDSYNNATTRGGYPPPKGIHESSTIIEQYHNTARYYKKIVRSIAKQNDQLNYNCKGQQKQTTFAVIF